MIRIYNFPRGARGVRAGWVCEEMSLPYEFVPVGFPPSEDFIARNPLGTVPVLEDGAVTISESVAIMLYLAQTYGPTPLLPQAPAFAQVLELTVFGEASLGACINPLLAAHFGAAPDDKRNWSVATLEARIERYLEYLSERLGANGYFVGSALTLADISVETALHMWQGVLGKPIPNNLAAYRDRLKAHSTYQRAMATQR
jgi:glutathione S-transferase